MTELGGASYIVLASHAAEAIAAGKCDVALVTLAGRPRSEGMATGTAPRPRDPNQPEGGWEGPYAITTANAYAMGAMRHMYEYGTTSEQLAWVKVAASHHAQYNPHADAARGGDRRGRGELADDRFPAASARLLRDQRRRRRDRHRPAGDRQSSSGRWSRSSAPARRSSILGAGTFDITTSGAARSGPIAFAEAGGDPADIKYASIYDSFTITVVIQIEDLGFCAKGAGGKFVADGNLISGTGKLPFNTDGGGLCNNHPANRGEHDQGDRGGAAAARRGASGGPGQELRPRAGAGYRVSLATRHGSGTLIMERE